MGWHQSAARRRLIEGGKGTEWGQWASPGESFERSGMPRKQDFTVVSVRQAPEQGALLDTHK